MARAGDRIIRRACRLALGATALTATILPSTNARATPPHTWLIPRVRAPIGIHQARFEKVLQAFLQNAVFEQAKAIVFFGSRTHHDYGWKPQPGSDHDIAIYIPKAYLTGTQEKGPRAKSDKARTLAHPMKDALDQLVNGEQGAPAAGTLGHEESPIELSVAPFVIETALEMCSEFACYLPLAAERRLFAEVAGLEPRNRQKASYNARKLEIEQTNAPPATYPDPSWYDRQAIVLIRPNLDQLGRILDKVTVQKLVDLGYENVILPQLAPQ